MHWKKIILIVSTDIKHKFAYLRELQEKKETEEEESLNVIKYLNFD